MESTIKGDQMLGSDAARAALSEGRSNDAIYGMVSRAIAATVHPRATVVDIGCGGGKIYRWVSGYVANYVGCDLVAYEGFPRGDGTRFVSANLNDVPYPIDSNSADIGMSIETIEHLENPRALIRELTRIVRPGGTVIATTPNQLSILSKVTLAVKHQFNAFQAPDYPAHITALLPIDLERIARECGLTNIRIMYSNAGRVPFTGVHWPKFLSGREFSDNVMLVASKRD